MNYEGLNFSANYNDDFITDKSDIISIAAGSTSANVKITGKDDSDEDPNENIVIQLNSTTGTPASENIIFEPQSVTVKIIDDDNPRLLVQIIMMVQTVFLRMERYQLQIL